MSRKTQERLVRKTENSGVTQLVKGRLPAGLHQCRGERQLEELHLVICAAIAPRAQQALCVPREARQKRKALINRGKKITILELLRTDCLTQPRKNWEEKWKKL